MYRPLTIVDQPTLCTGHHRLDPPMVTSTLISRAGVFAAGALLVAGCSTSTSTNSPSEGPPETESQPIAVGTVVNGCPIRPATKCPGVDLSGQNLTGADLSGADLEGANFTDAKLQGATFLSTFRCYDGSTDEPRVDLVGANFTRADLTGATVTGASMDTVNFTEANLTHTTFMAAVSTEPTSSTCNGGRRHLDADRATFTGATAPNANWTNAEFDGSDFAGIDLTDAVLTESSFGRGNLTNAKLIRADLTDTDMTYANLQGADLTGAAMFSTDFWGATCPVGQKLPAASGVKCPN